jgi:hypothetical protein
LVSTVTASITPIALAALKWWWIKKLVDTAFDKLGQWSFEQFALEKQKYKEGMWGTFLEGNGEQGGGTKGVIIRLVIFRRRASGLWDEFFN